MGSTERLEAVLSDESIDVDEGGPGGRTPLMLATCFGHSRSVRILLNKGASVTVADDQGHTALNIAAQQGHVAITKMLVKAGGGLEAATAEGATPMHMAAQKGFLGVMSVLIQEGANPDSVALNGQTPLHVAAKHGHPEGVRMLLRAGANPRLTTVVYEPGTSNVPLDLAAYYGHLGVVRELVQQVGIDGCGGPSGGVEALRMAAMKQHVDIMGELMGAGVVDTGVAMANCSGYGREQSVKFLLQHRKGGDEAAYVNSRKSGALTPLLDAIGGAGRDPSSPSPRIVRLLVDAGADTTSAVRFRNTADEEELRVTPLAVTAYLLREKIFAGKSATEEQLHKLQRIRRLLLRVAAVRAASFLWPAGVPSTVAAAEGTTNRTTTATPTPLRTLLSLLRRRARRPGVLLAALWRWVPMLSDGKALARAFPFLSTLRIGFCFCCVWWCGDTAVPPCIAALGAG